MASTYEPIATTTLGSAQTGVTFSSISSVYTDLVMVASVGANSDTEVFSCRINGDNGTNYSVTGLWGTGAGSGTSARETSQTQLSLTKGIGVGTANASMVVICNFQNYSNSTTYKTVLTRGSEASATYPGTELNVGLWRNTNAITSLQFTLANGTSTFNTGSTFTLYGIKAA
jgi:hypothetical protein